MRHCSRMMDAYQIVLPWPQTSYNILKVHAAYKNVKLRVLASVVGGSILSRAVSCYRRAMLVHRAPAPLGGPLKLQVRPQYLRNDPMEKVWKVPSTVFVLAADSAHFHRFSQLYTNRVICSFNLVLAPPKKIPFHIELSFYIEISMMWWAITMQR